MARYKSFDDSPDNVAEGTSRSITLVSIPEGYAAAIDENSDLMIEDLVGTQTLPNIGSTYTNPNPEKVIQITPAYLGFYGQDIVDYDE